jgi:hypothetical protein
MKLSAEEFRGHMDQMINEKNTKQARIWAESGTLIYTNFEELHEIFEEEYAEILNA